MQPLSAKQHDPRRPEYLVVFHEASEKNISTISAVSRRGQARSARARRGVAVLESGDSGTYYRVYHDLGACSCDLTESQRKALEKREDVAAVVVNQVRPLPRTASIPLSAGEGPSANHSALEAYLRGIRDTADLALRFVNPAAPSASGVAEASAFVPLGSPLSRPLQLMGIGPSTTFTGRGVKVAVLDTGIDLAHRDLGSKVVEGETAVSLLEGFSVQDDFGHGTHCAGVVAGPADSVIGTRYGVAPDATLLFGRVFDDRIVQTPEGPAGPFAADSDVLDGIAFADENGARIVSLSLGGERNPGEPFSVAYETIARRLLDRPQNSILIVAAAGNESERPFSTAAVGNPAACPSIMAVAAVDDNLRIAPFSCRKKDSIGEVNVSGPGVRVLSAVPTNRGEFARMSGTSMATPHVAGLACLYLEREPGLSARQLLDKLTQGARRLGNRDDFGAGLARL